VNWSEDGSTGSAVQFEGVTPVSVAGLRSSMVPRPSDVLREIFVTTVSSSENSLPPSNTTVGIPSRLSTIAPPVASTHVPTGTSNLASLDRMA